MVAASIGQRAAACTNGPDSLSKVSSCSTSDERGGGQQAEAAMSKQSGACTMWDMLFDRLNGMKCKLTPGSTLPQSGLHRGRPQCIYRLEERFLYAMQCNGRLFVRHSKPRSPPTCQKLALGQWPSMSDTDAQGTLWCLYGTHWAEQQLHR